MRDECFVKWKKVLYDGYTYFNSPCHPLEAELHHQEFNAAADTGIGILPFFHGKNILLTGATGLLGKVLVEKILRSMSVGKIYLLIKAKDKEAASTRLTNEITNSDLFKTLKEELGDSYETMIREKLIPIAGNICEPNLGMDSQSIAQVRKDVDVIIQSAASTVLNDRYDLLVDANMSAPQRLMRFAKTCNNLTLFAHISTAYVSGKREGLIMEKPFIMGGNGRKEEYCVESALLDLVEENNLILKLSSSSSTQHDLTKNLKRLAQDRATEFGWHNSYHMTKAMGEMALDEIRGDVPLLIIRPTVIESTYRDPFPGWIQGNRMFDPVIMAYGKGQLPGFFGDSQVVMDVIPVDMVANTTIAAIAKEGNMHRPQPQPSVYHVASSATNPLLYSDFFEYLFHYFNSAPLIPSQKISRIKYFDNFQDFSEYTRNSINGDEKMTLKSRNQAKAKVAYANKLCKLYEFIGFFSARFDTSNTKKLIEAMSKEERVSFEVDASNIEWKKYFEEIHIPGLIKHMVNGSM
ncbi:fatty acyl-CoA reductase 2, chloroplastic-like [Salvia hispanica]|uniref:fatty acyl-CoA reductase 2, chloroplastic-like n=1 Tax=Salvia hispanica TaxID=49212 RepID=UPI00200999E3|nr:fatty acyl-CoA reductase 2, chloroplastic-like [Salvia hispanica]